MAVIAKAGFLIIILAGEANVPAADAVLGYFTVKGVVGGTPDHRIVAIPRHFGPAEVVCGDLVDFAIPGVEPQTAEISVIPDSAYNPQAGYLSSQFSTLRPRMRLNSRVLSVTNVRPSALACAAISRSFMPIG